MIAVLPQSFILFKKIYMQDKFQPIQVRSSFIQPNDNYPCVTKRYLSNIDLGSNYVPINVFSCHGYKDKDI